MSAVAKPLEDGETARGIEAFSRRRWPTAAWNGPARTSGLAPACGYTAPPPTPTGSSPRTAGPTTAFPCRSPDLVLTAGTRDDLPPRRAERPFLHGVDSRGGRASATAHSDSSLFSMSRGAWNFLLLSGKEKVAASPPQPAESRRSGRPRARPSAARRRADHGDPPGRDDRAGRQCRPPCRAGHAVRGRLVRRGAAGNAAHRGLRAGRRRGAARAGRVHRGDA